VSKGKNLLYPLSLFFLLLSFLHCPTKTKDLSKPCFIEDVEKTALERVGEQEDGSVVLYTGRKIQPWGKWVSTGTFPLNATYTPSGTLAVVMSGNDDVTLPERARRFGIPWATSSSQSIDFVDLSRGTLLYTLPVKSLFYGVAWHPSGVTLYASGGGRDLIREIEWNPTSYTAREVTTYRIFGYPTGIALKKDGKTLLVALMHRHRVVEYFLPERKVVREFVVEGAPLEIILSSDEKKAFVSNWGSNTVSILDLTSGKTVTHVVVGKNPEGMALSPDEEFLYVAVSDEDTVAKMDLKKFQVESFSLHDPGGNLGISPTDLFYHPSGKLYITTAFDNTVYVMDPEKGTIVGAIPAGMHPTRILLDPYRNQWIIINAKGKGSRPNTAREFVGGIIPGSVQLVEENLPEEKLKEGLKKVQEMNNIFTNLYGDTCKGKEFPVPFEFGKRSSFIRHVVFIMRENKTYDSYLGDLGPEYDGDPNLVLFGEEITPNLHKLTRTFSNMTNFYNESDQSVQGHVWVSIGFVNDFTEKNWIAMWGRSGEAQLIIPGLEPASYPKSGDFFNHLKNHGISVKNYGEYTLAGLEITTGTRFTNWKFPSNLGVDDRVKIREFLRDLENGDMAEFVYMTLPNDHTYGLLPSAPTPEYMVADNDEATGRVVEAISKSPFWKSTVIFIFEDDPQGTPDHIDAHRSIMVVISPWVKRNYISRVRGSFPSLLKTASLILGVPPLNRAIALASTFHDLFTPIPDFTPYTAIPSKVPLQFNPAEGPLAEASKKLDFTTVDQAPELGKILWKYRKGDQPFPEDLVEKE